MLIPLSALRRALLEMLQSTGMKNKSAETIGGVFIDGILRGHANVALGALSILIDQLQNGYANPVAEPILVKESTGAAVIDSRNGPGQLAGVLAADTAVTKAKHAGICTVGVMNGVSSYRPGYYAERIADAGMTGLVFSGTTPIGEFLTDSTALSQTSLAMAVPTGEEQAIVHELTGASLKGHKGFGLSLAAELLSHISSLGRSMGSAVIAIDPAAFVGSDEFRRRVSAYAGEVKASRRISNAERIEMPGDAELESKRQILDLGKAAIESAAWNTFENLADRMKIKIIE